MSSISVKVLDARDSAKVAAFLSEANVEMGRPRPPNEVSNLIKTWLEEQKNRRTEEQKNRRTEEQKNEMCPLVAFKNDRAVGIVVLDERDPNIAYLQWAS